MSAQRLRRWPNIVQMCLLGIYQNMGIDSGRYPSINHGIFILLVLHGYLVINNIRETDNQKISKDVITHPVRCGVNLVSFLDIVVIFGQCQLSCNAVCDWLVAC